jgi:hypothetical protein
MEDFDSVKTWLIFVIHGAHCKSESTHKIYISNMYYIIYVKAADANNFLQFTEMLDTW